MKSCHELYLKQNHELSLVYFSHLLLFKCENRTFAKNKRNLSTSFILIKENKKPNNVEETNQAKSPVNKNISYRFSSSSRFQLVTCDRRARQQKKKKKESYLKK